VTNGTDVSNEPGVNGAPQLHSARPPLRLTLDERLRHPSLERRAKVEKRVFRDVFSSVVICATSTATGL